jgi:hypothetical protein
MSAKKMMKLDVRNGIGQSFEPSIGKKLIGGQPQTAEDFFQKPSARLRLFCRTETGEAVEVVVTPKNVQKAEFKALTKLMKTRGTLEVEGEVTTEFSAFDGTTRQFQGPRVDVTWTKANGEANFKFVEAPAPKWAQEYVEPGDTDVQLREYGADPEQVQKFGQLRRGPRKNLDQLLEEKAAKDAIVP